LGDGNSDSAGETANGPLESSREQVARAIAIWLRNSVWPEFWDKVMSRAASRMMHASPPISRKYSGAIQGLTMERLIEECRPTDQLSPGEDTTDYVADSIVESLTFVCREPNQIREILRIGLEEARRWPSNGSWERHDSPLKEQMSMVRYISDIKNVSRTT
jgi:hypothetical protein